MAEIDDPELVAQIVRQLNVKGPLQPFQIPEVAMPVFDIGRLTALDLPTRVGTASANSYLPSALPVLESGDFFDGEFDTNPAAGAVVVNTQNLPAGVYQVRATISSTVSGRFLFSWRNAANTADVATWSFEVSGDHPPVLLGPFMCNVALNQRFQISVPNAIVGTVATGLIVSLNSASVA